MDKRGVAEALSREHGKTIPDAKGDVQRGLEVVEFLHRARRNLLKGEFTDSAGPGIDMYSMRQPIGVAAGITPFNFPAMDPDVGRWPPRWSAETPSSSSRRSVTRRLPLMLAELDAGGGACPTSVLQVINGRQGGRRRHPRQHRPSRASALSGPPPSRQYIYERGCANGKRVQCFGGAKNHMIIMPDADMDQAADALVGAGFGAAGERCMAISVRRTRGRGNRRPADRETCAQDRGAQGRPLHGRQ